MQSFGDKLKQEREAKDVTIEQLALATGIELAYLEALERNDFQALPGQAFGKLYIREYAEVLRFDPRPLIEDYDRERQRRSPTASEPARPSADRPRRVKAAIDQWREEKLQERAGVPREAEPAEPEVPEPREQESPPARPPPEPGEPAHHQAVEVAKHDGVAGTDEPAAVNAGPEISRGQRRRFVAMAAAGGVVLGVAVVVSILFTRTGEVERDTAGKVATAREEPPPPIESAPPQEPIETPLPPEKPRPPTVAAPLALLEVSDFGVGRKVGRSGLEDPVDTFAQGDVAYFSTRVLGGSRAERVRHVWIFEGRIQQTIQLRLGGPSWHTYSSKRLGNAGQWAVEARDQKGRVLARSTFTCSAGSP